MTFKIWSTSGFITEFVGKVIDEFGEGWLVLVGGLVAFC